MKWPFAFRGVVRGQCAGPDPNYTLEYDEPVMGSFRSRNCGSGENEVVRAWATGARKLGEGGGPLQSGAAQLAGCYFETAAAFGSASL